MYYDEIINMTLIQADTPTSANTLAQTKIGSGLELLDQGVLIIGNGLMGLGLAQLCASHGLKVRVLCRTTASANVARTKLKARIARNAAKGIISLDESDTVFGRISFSTELETFTPKAQATYRCAFPERFIIESIAESVTAKQEVIHRVSEKMHDDCLIATNTSSLSVRTIAEACRKQAQCLGMHFFNPPTQMELVEIVRHSKLDPNYLQHAKSIAKTLKKEVIVVNDSPGFASSRLGIVQGLEAMRMLEQGVSSAEEIDKAMTFGYKHPVGPLKLTDMVGLDIRLKIAEHLYRSLGGDQFRPPQVLKDMVADGRLGRKSGQGFYTWQR